MRTESLLTFAAVAEEMSYTKAAERLFLTPSTVHQQVRALEAEFGTKLVHVAGKEVLLTEAGQRFLDCGKAIQQLLSEFEIQVKTLHERKADRVRIGASSYFGIMADAAQALAAAHPEMQVEFRTLRPWQAVDELRRGAIDFGFVGSMFLASDLVAEPCAENRIRVVVPKDHPWATQPEVPIDELDRFPFVGYQSSSARRAVDEWLAAHPTVRIRYAAEVISSIDVKATARLMNLPAFLVDRAADGELRDGTLVQLSLPYFHAGYTLFVVQRPNLEDSPAAMAFLEQLRTMYAARQAASAVSA